MSNEIQLENAILQLEREIAMESLEEFVKTFWSVLIDNELIWNWHMSVMCKELQIVAERVMSGEPKLYDLIIGVPPGSSKSTIGSVMLPAWIWTKKQSMRVFNITYAQTLSNDLSLKCRTIIESDKYKQLFPEIQLKKDNNQKSFFQNEGKGYRYATSCGGTVTGMHAHLLICDDIVNAAQANSVVEVDKANEWLSSTLSTRYVDKNVGTLIMIMQRLSPSDPTAYLLERNKNNIKHICLPAELTDDVKPIELRDNYRDGLLDPIRMTKKYLMDFEAANGSYVYAGQMLMAPVPPDGGMFDTREVEIVDSYNPDDVIEMYRSWDKAGTNENRKKNPMACYTAGVKMAKLKDGSFIILDTIRGRWSADKREVRIKKAAIKDTRRCKILQEIEPGSGGKESAENTIKNLAGFNIFSERPTGNKIFRADAFAANVNIGNVKMLRGAWNNDYINEMKHFPNSRFKDQIDASSAAFNRLNKACQPRIRNL